MALNEQTDVKTDDHPHIMEGSEESQIQKMFLGSTVFVTGGTGFLGKLLIEKLLRSCPDIKKLYLLTRPKKNKDIKKRLQEQFDDVLYDELRKKMPDFVQKIDIVEGDMGEINMGISDADRKKLINEVKFIFHGAATVRFDEVLKKAVEINVRGTREMLQLARACTKLRAFIYISTAYSNCNLNEIDEKFYGSNLSGDMLINLVENMDENTLKNITPGLLDNLPNTYTYSKLTAEEFVQKHSQGVPVAVFRPSIMIPTASEPVAGWIDNIYGPTGVIVTAGLGLLHSLQCNPQVLADMVPGDYVINGIIAAAWKTAKDYPENYEHTPVDSSPIIYNYVSSVQNPITWGAFMHSVELNRYPLVLSQVMWKFLFLLTPSKFLHNFYCILLHWIPAYIVDTIAIMIGKQPVLKKTYRKIEKFSEVISIFCTREWKFHNKNTLNLLKELNDADQHIFNFDIKTLNWDEFCTNYVKGIRLYLLKDPLETIPQAKKKYCKILLAHYILVSLITFGLLVFIRFLVKLFI